jgi:hypothetical protein
MSGFRSTEEMAGYILYGSLSGKGMSNERILNDPTALCCSPNALS